MTDLNAHISHVRELAEQGALGLDPGRCVPSCSRNVLLLTLAPPGFALMTEETR
jgi:hypothetical protein